MKRIPHIILGAILVASFSHAEETSRFIQLKDSWQKARERAMAPVDQEYHTELQKLISIYTKARKLDAAVEARSELTRLHELMIVAKGGKTEKSKAVSIEEAILGDWTWNHQNKAVGFLEGGVFQFYWDLSQKPSLGKWMKESQSKVKIIFPDDGWRFEMLVSESGKNARVKLLDKEGVNFEISKK